MGKTQDDIEQVIPHRGAMRLVDQVLAWDDQSIAVGLTVPLDGLFHETGGVPVWVGLEYMAQAISAWSGRHVRNRGESLRIGFLLGTRRYSAETSHFAPGAVLRVEARRELEDEDGLGMFACRILDGERVLASANVSVYQPNDAQIEDLLGTRADPSVTVAS